MNTLNSITIIPKELFWNEIVAPHWNVQMILSVARTSKSPYKELIENFKGIWDRSVDSGRPTEMPMPLFNLFKFMDGCRKVENDYYKALSFLIDNEHLIEKALYDDTTYTGRRSPQFEFRQFLQTHKSSFCIKNMRTFTSMAYQLVSSSNNVSPLITLKTAFDKIESVYHKIASMQKYLSMCFVAGLLDRVPLLVFAIYLSSTFSQPGAGISLIDIGKLIVLTVGFYTFSRINICEQFIQSCIQNANIYSINIHTEDQRFRFGNWFLDLIALVFSAYHYLGTLTPRTDGQCPAYNLR